MGEWLVYTDGSAKAGGPGGWAFVLKPPSGAGPSGAGPSGAGPSGAGPSGAEAVSGTRSSVPLERYGKAADTIAKIMEYRAVAEAVAALPDGASALVFSDNMSLVENLGKKLDIWRQNGFSKVDPAVVADVRRIADAIEAKNLRLRFQWVKSHNGNAGNERADALAAQGAREAKAERR